MYLKAPVPDTSAYSLVSEERSTQNFIVMGKFCLKAETMTQADCTFKRRAVQEAPYLTMEEVRVRGKVSDAFLYPSCYALEPQADNEMWTPLDSAITASQSVFPMERQPI